VKPDLPFGAFTGKRMVNVSARRCHIGGEQIHDIHKGGILSPVDDYRAARYQVSEL
jgi:hypothetical protein